MRKLTSLQKSRHHLTTAIILVIFCFPLYWAIINSIKMPLETFAGSWVPFLQFKPTLVNWAKELGDQSTRRALANSTIVSLCSTGIVLFIGTLAAFSLAVFKFEKLKNQDIIIWFLSQRVMPPVIFIVPFFLLMRSLKLIDSLYALILVNVTFVLPFAVIIMREIFRGIPGELIDAALVDGASYWQIFRKVALPLASGGLVATGIICLAIVWNEFIFALSLSYDRAVVMPVVIAGSEHTRGVEFWYIGVRVLLTMSLPVVVALFAQRYLVKGLTLGAVKG